ncbi:MoaD/ThiS family protein [Orrella daihaiensis]|uniref:MoaD/ThiS family protein n=1 Tax=Orrella daihaiensis TaxID=2782176 RepID=A0ABY4APN8_9BURK|nr:MoaD/ThiS family protein [Orrella daihaiensis]UOD51025.1 MoaD/ThiS family protein [Orrella daihaiensis]
MKVQVLFFGELRETVGTAYESVEVVAGMSVSDLIEQLAARGEPWKTAFKASDPLRVAINKDMATLHAALPDNAEVAFFRPVTGG